MTFYFETSWKITSIELINYLSIRSRKDTKSPYGRFALFDGPSYFKLFQKL